ncbi:MAG TPA: TonB-dependent receptor, partial [Idiomarina abyssalis]
MFNTTFKRTAVAAAIAMGLAGSAVAQETSSSLRGVVTTESGQVVSNATIQLRDERTGSVKTLRSNEQGTFSSRGLPVGGPYTLVVEGPEGRTQVVEDVYLTLGDSQNVNVMLERQADMERLSVTGSMTSNALYGSNSPAANFNLEDLENAPAANRDLKDVVRIDPRIYINETNAGDIQCGGANP